MQPERALSHTNTGRLLLGGTPGQPQSCPHCGGPLRYPGTLDACMNCGYTRAQSRAPSPQRQKPTRSNALMLALGEVPPWVWALACGCVVVLAFCAFASMRLPASGLERALVGTALMGVGIAGAIAAEIWVVPLIAFDAPLLSIVDFLVPFRLWGVALAKLPRTYRPVCLLSWSMTAMFGGIVVVGGLWYWLPDKHRARFRLESPVAATFGSEADGSTEEVVYQSKELDPKNKQSSSDDQDPDDASSEKTTLRCLVLGYIPDKDGLGLVLGIEEKGQVRYAGVVRRGLNLANTEQVQKQLAVRARLEPPLPDLPVKAIWLEPGIQCEVTQTGAGTAAILPDPVFRDLVPDPKQKDQ